MFRRKIAGSVAIVTGATSGIGRAISVELARQGASLVLAGRRTSNLQQVAAECVLLGAKCEVVPTDVRIPSDCERLIARALEVFGTVDILVNNAGYAVFDSIHVARTDDLASMMDTNYFGAVRCTQAILPHMLERGDGAIVNIASITGIMGFARMGGYAATKFALIGFTEALRNEVIDRGITVSMICPGTTETEFFRIAERGKMPAASRLVLAIKPARVARTVCRAIRWRRRRIIVPVSAAIYMRFKELMPGTAHWLMRRVSNALPQESSD